MYIVHVSIKIKPESVDAFIQATIGNASNSVHEPGIARFDFIQEADDPTRFMLIEVYRTPDDAVKHKQTAHYAAWLETVTDMMPEPRTRIFYRNVFPADADWD